MKFSSFLSVGLLAAGLSSGCSLFIKPEPKLITMEQIQGGYTYEEGSTTHTGRFLVVRDSSRMALDIFGPFYLPVAHIRYTPDSTLLLMPLSNELLILDSRDILPFQGWELPLHSLDAGFRNGLPEEPDTSWTTTDTLFFIEKGLTYTAQKKDSTLTEIRGPGWSLEIEGRLTADSIKMPVAKKISFTRSDVKLDFESDKLELVYRSPGEVFGLHSNPDASIQDYRITP